LLNNKLRFVAGVRYEKTNDKGEGVLSNADAVWQRNPNGSYVDGDLVTAGVQRVRKLEAGVVGSMEELRFTRIERGYKADHTYDGVYPSLHLTYNITDDLLARFSYAKTVGRPDYANIIPNTDINEDDTNPSNPGSITIRNTGLRPWTADNFDLSLEYYFKKGGLVSVGVFEKDLADFWSAKTGAMTQEDLDELGLDAQYLGWQVTSLENGGSAKIKGVEVNVIQPLTFLPGWGKYFTLKANGTLLDLSGDNSPDFRGFIEETGNFNIAFNKAPFAFNLTFNYRGRQIGSSGTAAFLQTGAQYGATTGFKEYYAPRTFVDFSGEYKISKNLSLFGGVRNLFNKEQMLRRYNDTSADYARNYRQEEFGIACSVGIKGTF
jgi:iron complex outermembrane recepter protein